MEDEDFYDLVNSQSSDGTETEILSKHYTEFLRKKIFKINETFPSLNEFKLVVDEEAWSDLKVWFTDVIPTLLYAIENHNVDYNKIEKGKTH